MGGTASAGTVAGLQTSGKQETGTRWAERRPPVQLLDFKLPDNKKPRVNSARGLIITC